MAIKGGKHIYKYAIKTTNELFCLLPNGKCKIRNMFFRDINKFLFQIDIWIETQGFLLSIFVFFFFFVNVICIISAEKIIS